MSQQSNKKSPIPPNRSFQRTNIASFTEARRQRFLIQRKQNRESYFEKARKIALNADKNSDNDSNEDNDHSNTSTFDFSIQFHQDYDINTAPQNKFSQYPPPQNEQNDIDQQTHSQSQPQHNIMNTDNHQHQKQHQSQSPPSSPKNKKKRRKKKKNKQNAHPNKRQAMYKARKSRMKYVNMFMVHEWMTDIPSDLTQNWMVGLRADGDRCLVFAHGGRTTSRNRTGNFIHARFPSSLPGGNIAQQKKTTVTILDCIWIQHIKTYYVIDCILWCDQKIGSSDASMRLWFVKSKLEECWNIDAVSKYNKYRFQSIKTYEINANNLKYLYNGGDLLNDQDINNEHEEEKQEKNKNKDKKIPNYNIIGADDKNQKKKYYKIEPDGFIFYHKFGCYVQGISCPLILIWKDNKISRWFVDTSNRQNKNKLLQFISLQLRSNGTITTHEKDIVLSVMSPQLIKKNKFKPNDLLRFSITNAKYEYNHDDDVTGCKVDNILYIKKCSNSKMLPDTWSKIMFQHQAKNNQSVTFDHLIKSVNTNDDQNNNDMTVMDNDDWQKCEQNVDAYLRTATVGLESFHI